MFQRTIFRATERPGMRHVTAALIIMKSKRVWSILDARNVSNKVQYSKSYAGVDLLKHVTLQNQMFELFASSISWVSRAISNQELTTLTIWVVLRNAFQLIFKHGIGKIFESGLSTRWDKVLVDNTALKNVYIVERTLNNFDTQTEDLSSFVRNELWSHLYSNSKFDPNKTQNAPMYSCPTATKIFEMLWMFIGAWVRKSVDYDRDSKNGTAFEL